MGNHENQNHQENQSLDYVKAVYAHVEHWYENADRKAQIVLVFDGAFLSFITSQVFDKAADLKVITECGGTLTISLLALMGTFLAASVICAIICLHPRLVSRSIKSKSILEQEKVKNEPAEPIPARLLWYFGNLARLNQERVATQLQKVDEPFAIEALAHEAAKFSRNVWDKHTWVNRAFVFAGTSLILLLLAAASYWWSIPTCEFLCTGNEAAVEG